MIPGVVTMPPEMHYYAVTRVLGDEATETRDRLANVFSIGPHDLAQVFGMHQ